MIREGPWWGRTTIPYSGGDLRAVEGEGLADAYIQGSIAVFKGKSKHRLVYLNEEETILIITNTSTSTNKPYLVIYWKGEA